MKGKLVLLLFLIISSTYMMLMGLNVPAAKASNADHVHNLNTGLNYTTIQEAIDANNTLDGHTIFVDAGTYDIGAIIVNKSLKIIGDGMSNTTIYGYTPHYPLPSGYAVFRILAENVSISGFTIKHSPKGYYGTAIGILKNSRNDIVSNNNISFNCGIYLESTYNNTISKNIIKSDVEAIHLTNASQNTITDNIITNGIVLFNGSSNNVLVGNKLAGRIGVSITCLSKNNILRNNTFNSFRVGGFRIDDYIQDIDDSNTICGKPIYYWVNKYNEQLIPEDAGFVAVISSTNTVIGNLNLKSNILLVNTTDSEIRNVTLIDHNIEILFGSRNTILNSMISSPGSHGILIQLSNYTRIVNNQIVNTSYEDENILLDHSNYNFLLGNKISDGWHGIRVTTSNHNIICENEISYNQVPIHIWNSVNNSIYHNNFRYNTNRVACYSSTNYWDNGYPSGGNYWSDYTGTDYNQGSGQNISGSDGIGDTRYSIDVNNTDHYPLMGVFFSFNTSLGYSIGVISNSTVESSAYFESNSTIQIRVSNMTANQTNGFCRLTIPHDLFFPPYTITINGTHVSYTLIFENMSLSILYFSYEHSTLEIIIVPEFPLFLILPLFMTATLLAVIIYGKKRISTR